MFVPALEPEIAHAAATSIAETGYPRVPDDVFRRAWLRRTVEDPLGAAWLAALKAGRLVSVPYDFANDLESPTSQRLYLLVGWLALVGLISPLAPLDRSARLLLAAVPAYSLALYVPVRPGPALLGAIAADARDPGGSRHVRPGVMGAGTDALAHRRRPRRGERGIAGAVLLARTEVVPWSSPSSPPYWRLAAEPVIGCALVALATVLGSATRAPLAVALVILAVTPFWALPLANLETREPTVVLTADQPALRQQWSGAPAPSAPAEVLIGLPLGPQSVEVTVNGVRVAPDTGRTLYNSWWAFPVPADAASGQDPWTVEVRVAGPYALVGTMTRGPGPNEVRAASLSRQISETDTKGVHGPMRQIYAVSGQATAQVVTPTGSAVPLDVQPRIFLLLHTEAGHQLR